MWIGNTPVPSLAFLSRDTVKKTWPCVWLSGLHTTYIYIHIHVYVLGVCVWCVWVYLCVRNDTYYINHYEHTCSQYWIRIKHQSTHIQPILATLRVSKNFSGEKRTFTLFPDIITGLPWWVKFLNSLRNILLPGDNWENLAIALMCGCILK